MSRYSFENYEKIPTVKYRPALSAPRGAHGGLSVLRLDWNQTADDRIRLKSPAPTEAEADTVLEPKLIPAECGKASGGFDAARAEAFIRRLGADTDGAKGYAGVVVDGEHIRGMAFTALLRAWMQSFDNTSLLIRVPSAGCHDVIQALRCEGVPFGLLLDASDGLIAVRRQLAALGLQRVWKSSPVFLLAENAPEPREQVLRAARGWHVAAADIAGLKPGQMALRRLSLPEELSCGGALPLRFWWHNAGDCPIYGKTQVRIALRSQNGAETIIPVNDTAPLRQIGDGTHNEIVRLPALEAGKYELACGMFRDGGTPLELAIQAPCKNGFYALGTIKLDNTPRPELYDIWNGFYPEGYYPLEDPKLPV